MHRVIMDCPKGLVVDHIDGNTLNNRRSNLRICTFGENLRNQRPRTNRIRKSAYKGVCWLETRQRWIANCGLDGKQYRSGHFRTEIEAAHAYDELAKRHHGEFASLNFPPKPPTLLQKFASIVGAIQKDAWVDRTALGKAV